MRRQGVAGKVLQNPIRGWRTRELQVVRDIKKKQGSDISGNTQEVFKRGACYCLEVGYASNDHLWFELLYKLNEKV
jgi:hypothetical protein